MFTMLGGCAQDKILHFGAGAVTAAIVTEITDDPMLGCLAALGVGIGKEIYDSRTHAADPMDIFATGFGCSVTIVF